MTGAESAQTGVLPTAPLAAANVSEHAAATNCLRITFLPLVHWSGATGVGGNIAGRIRVTAHPRHPGSTSVNAR
ncbi:hypothetical protein GCM10025857_24300 [Alicyclobacillus contaminans]|nr:hypothetical protein GCM10025857_24300 [Alicyclobacillus contaminans]